jgi:6-phosphogluconolactonase
MGESDPYIEIKRYSDEISAFTKSRNGFPVFNLVMLGLGADGHTASIFPGNADLITSGKICDVTSHPSTKQKRVTITGKVINNADRVVFLVTGKNKASVIEKIVRKRKSAAKFPASYVLPTDGSLTWYLDKEAAEMLK